MLSREGGNLRLLYIVYLLILLCFLLVAEGIETRGWDNLRKGSVNL